MYIYDSGTKPTPTFLPSFTSFLYFLFFFPLLSSSFHSLLFLPSFASFSYFLRLLPSVISFFSPFFRFLLSLPSFPSFLSLPFFTAFFHFLLLFPSFPFLLFLPSFSGGRGAAHITATNVRSRPILPVRRAPAWRFHRRAAPAVPLCGATALAERSNSSSPNVGRILPPFLSIQSVRAPVGQHGLGARHVEGLAPMDRRTGVLVSRV